uniref:AlNc14C111G6396 protein n=1 Tax=Albugo laibachii Nc14 TaxID=890382 RepID=F0WIJ6_9STRA|nr:AlNc14C111G6396 [Albugo laibachii Nc14]|eukprot:CCA21078.1 AlNc14C111G6396 [Albugo laibachii Nc14]
MNDLASSKLIELMRFCVPNQKVIVCERIESIFSSSLPTAIRIPLKKIPQDVSAYASHRRIDYRHLIHVC